MHLIHEQKTALRRFALCLLLLYFCCGVTACIASGNTESTDGVAYGGIAGNGAGRESADNAAEIADTEGLVVCFFACSDDADSILLKAGDTDILIDTGLEEDAGRLLHSLKQYKVDDIELLVLTHPDKDHIGGVARVLDHYLVEQVIQTSCEKDSELQGILDEKLKEENTELSMPERLCTLEYGELVLRIYPPKQESYDNSNNYSIAVLAEYEGIRFFFAGDAKKKRVDELLEEELPEVDVYKTAHHGRDNKGSAALIERLQPDHAVVTAKEPGEKTKEALLSAGADIYSTYGKDVVFTVSNGILDVE